MIEDAVTELREKFFGSATLARPAEPPEARLETACRRGRGHVLITGSDREEIDDLLRRTLEKLEPMATVRTTVSAAEHAVDATLARVLGETPEHGLIARRARLLELLDRAQQADRSVFFVVDDADDDNLEQLERLVLSLEVTPEAAKRLRVVLVGNHELRDKIDDKGGRVLSARIYSDIRIGEPHVRQPAEIPAALLQKPGDTRSTSRAWSLATAVAVGFSLSVYASAFFFGRTHEPRSFSRGESSDAMANALGIASSIDAAPDTAKYLLGNEPFLRTPLAIKVTSSPRPQQRFSSAAAAPAVPAKARSSVSSSEPTRAVASSATRTAPIAARPAETSAADPPAAAKATPSRDSSIDALMSRFR